MVLFALITGIVIGPTAYFFAPRNTSRGRLIWSAVAVTAVTHWRSSSAFPLGSGSALTDVHGFPLAAGTRFSFRPLAARLRGNAARRSSCRQSAVLTGGTAIGVVPRRHCSVKLTVTVMMTGMGFPSRSVGSKRQPNTARKAATSSGVSTLRKTCTSATQPVDFIVASSITAP
jgi:hypothetical protein